jgi:DNA-binding NtrC family response regulator
MDSGSMKEAAALVLIVDDEVNLRESLVELVEGEGFNAAQAANGEEAVSVLRGGTVNPDVIFLDMRMPKLDGLGVLRLIQEERLTSAPIIVISAFGDSSKMIEAMRLGAYDYVTKALDLEPHADLTRKQRALRGQLHRVTSSRCSELAARCATSSSKSDASRLLMRHY